MNVISEKKDQSYSRRKFLKFTTLFSFSSILQTLFSFKARAGGFIPFAFIKKKIVTAPYVDDVFSTYLYTGNSSTQTITNGINLSTNGGLVWRKNRGDNSGHIFQDSIRGWSYALTSSGDAMNFGGTGTNAQSNFGGISSVSTTGLNINGSNPVINQTGANYVSWTFRKAANFFDLTTITKSAGSNATVSFPSLSTLGMVIVKRTDLAGSWYVWHKNLTSGKLLYLEQTAAEAALGHITVSGTTVTLVNGSGVADGTYIVYAYAHDSSANGIIQCGSLTAYSTISVGWEPQFVLVKTIAAAGKWYIFDSSRQLCAGNSTTSMKYLTAESTAAEVSDLGALNITSTGFSTTSGSVIGTGDQMIYMAIRRPNKPPTSGSQVFMAVAGSASGEYTAVAGFPVDMEIHGGRANSDKMFNANRICGNKYVSLINNNAEASYTIYWDNMTSFKAISTGDYSNNINWLFRRAPGFFDIVCYTGTGAARAINHNLGAIPELMIVKSRGSGYWQIYNSISGYSKVMMFDSFGEQNASDIWGGSAPSNTVFNLGYSAGNVNILSNTYFAYLFATLPGISKVGSYTGSASGTVVVPCGFSGSARFVLIKRTDSTGDWIVVDSTRGDTKYLCLNTIAAEVALQALTLTVGGFTTAAPGSLTNFSATATYIFLAIA
jgi:hypothetical protein